MCAYRLTTINADAATPSDDLPLPRGLQPADVMVAHSVLHTLAPTWTLDEHQDADDGALMLMLTPPGPEDATPTFVLSQHADGIQITATLGDSCDTLHTVSNIRRAMWAALGFHAQSMGLIVESLRLTARS